MDKLVPVCLTHSQSTLWPLGWQKLSSFSDKQTGLSKQPLSRAERHLNVSERKGIGAKCVPGQELAPKQSPRGDLSL